MTAIILARHGETELNVTEVFRGRVDIELNATGRTSGRIFKRCDE
jgi:broad specificity phosphatase PhoE